LAAETGNVPGGIQPYTAPKRGNTLGDMIRAGFGR
jgi:hypothetical protein